MAWPRSMTADGPSYRKNILGFGFVLACIVLYTLIAMKDSFALYHLDTSTTEEKFKSLKSLFVGIELSMSVICIAILLASMIVPFLLVEGKKTKLLPFLIAGIIDVVFTPVLFFLTRSTCPVPLAWVIHLSVFLGLAFVTRLRPYILPKKPVKAQPFGAI